MEPSDILLGKSFKQYYDQFQPQIKSLKKIGLFKALEAEVKKIYEHFISTSLCPDDLEKQETWRNAFFMGDFSPFGEFSEPFYEAFQLVSQKNEMIRQFIRFSLEDPEIHSGWDEFDRVLIVHSTRIASLYDPYFVAWARAVQNNPTATKLEDPQVAASLDKSFLSSYTILQLNDDGSFSQTPYATFFSSFIQPITDVFQHLIDQLELIHQKGTSSLPQDVQKVYIAYLKHYKSALLATDDLEATWEELDIKWMDVKHSIQIVHDIETGYGDPLRVKTSPEFSLRFIDESYEEANQTMSKIQDQLIEYFKGRDTDLSKKGLFSLMNCMSAIYYIPFQSGMGIQFRIAGQSIPNRDSVKDLKGVKLYFDPEAIKLGIEARKRMLPKVFNPQQIPQLLATLDPVRTIVYGTSTHEMGHSIYNLQCVAKNLLPTTTALLEEPRAELTALFSMNLLYKNKFSSLEETQTNLCCFMLGDIRRFSMMNSSGIRPYLISAISCYKLYLRHGYLVWDRDQDHLSVDFSKTLPVLEELSELFLSILKAEDEADYQKIEQILQDMQTETDLIKWLSKLTPQ